MASNLSAALRSIPSFAGKVVLVGGRKRARGGTRPCSRLITGNTSPGNRELTWYPRSEEETIEVGGQIAALCRAGDFVFLYGNLGAGKTCLARGIVRAILQDSGAIVASPTYLLHNLYEHESKPHITSYKVVSVNHIDLYRMKEGPNLLETLMTEEEQAAGVNLIEWPERLGATDLPHLEVKISINSDGGSLPRVVTATPKGKLWEERLFCGLEDTEQEGS